MMRKTITLLICLLLAFSWSSAFAGTGEQHEADLEKILLGRTLSKDSKDPQKQNGDTPAVLFGYLEDAIYLCIDQMGNQGQKWLDELNNDFHLEGLPTSINEISVPEEDHEKYTHLGWDYKYYQLPEKWKIRQNILLATVNKVFGFSTSSSTTENIYSEQCIEMAKLIYYIHILGDHQHNKLSTTTDRIQLRNATKTRGEVEAGLINELRQCISKLFWTQRTTGKYNWLMVKLNVVRFRAWRNGEEDSEEKHVKVQEIAEATLNYLQPQVKLLLLEMPFYRNAFQSIVVQD